MKGKSSNPSKRKKRQLKDISTNGEEAKSGISKAKKRKLNSHMSKESGTSSHTIENRSSPRLVSSSSCDLKAFYAGGVLSTCAYDGQVSSASASTPPPPPLPSLTPVVPILKLQTPTNAALKPTKIFGIKLKLTLKNKKKRKRKLRSQRSLADFELSVAFRRRHNAWRCKYRFGNGWSIEFDNPLGRSESEVKPAIEILSQNLSLGRAKATLQSDKNVYLCWIRKYEQSMVATCIIQVDHLKKRVNIEMLAVEQSHRKRGLAEMMLRLIQSRLIHFPKYDLFVMAANDALPFWSKPRFQFRRAHVSILDESEAYAQKKGDVTHMIWFGSHVTAQKQLLQLFIDFGKYKPRKKVI